MVKIKKCTDGWCPEVQLSKEDNSDDINPRVSMTAGLAKSWYIDGIIVIWETNKGNDKEINYIFGYRPGGGVEENAERKLQNVKLKIGQTPFSRSTVVSYTVGGDSPSLREISQSRYVSLKIYDLSGCCIKTLVDGQKPAGAYNINLNANELKTGIYFVQLNIDTFKTTKKIILMR
jgi:hypothetical protein